MNCSLAKNKPFTQILPSSSSYTHLLAFHVMPLARLYIIQHSIMNIKFTYIKSFKYFLIVSKLSPDVLDFLKYGKLVKFSSTFFWCFIYAICIKCSFKILITKAVVLLYVNTFEEAMYYFLKFQQQRLYNTLSKDISLNFKCKSVFFHECVYFLDI